MMPTVQTCKGIENGMPYIEHQELVRLRKGAVDPDGDILRSCLEGTLIMISFGILEGGSRSQDPRFALHSYTTFLY